ncbi:MAG: hypothetical protein IPQ27_12740 [Chitinophagaceae bacterium]|nr:hypothetical protein [Chitinophagaceae bacterium]MBK9958279.1 hypothetical protein [Chitinophagaceae bacterium]MBL0255755.1 hypothetical protein [Chitinophagaceae bacterium]
MNKFAYLVLAFMAFLAVSCSKSTEIYPSATIEDFAPMQIGKYITYRLDSTVTTNFGVAFEVHTYEVKFLVDAQITDNLGRPAYRIFRYIRNNPGQAWLPDNTFTATNTGTSFEFVENNLRYIKLKLPIKDNYSWKGNSYIESTSINTELMYLYDWDYFYENAYQPATVGSMVLDSTITINQREDSVGVPITPETQYAEKNISKEIYAKNIGMVYRNFLHWEFQRVNNSYTGYGVTYTLIDHN